MTKYSDRNQCSTITEEKVSTAMTSPPSTSCCLGPEDQRGTDIISAAAQPAKAKSVTSAVSMDI